MSLNIRTYHELTEADRSGLVDQIVAQRRRVADRLATVRRVVAVLSGKGGVGKSFVTTGLARALARSGQATGILDADFNGATIPALLTPPAARSAAPSSGRPHCSAWSRTWSAARSREARRTSSPPSSGSRCWRAYHSIPATTCGKTSSRSYNEIPLRRMRPADAVRGAAAPGGRH